MADDKVAISTVASIFRFRVRVLIVIVAAVCSPSHADANQAGREICEAGVRQAGFEPEKPYEFRQAGFFSKEKHIFGALSCELNSDGSIARVRRGESIVAEDGFFGVEELELRKRILQATSDKINEAAGERDRKIEEARNEYQKTTTEFEKTQQVALTGIGSGELKQDELRSLGFSEDEISAFETMLGVGTPSSSSEGKPEESAGAQETPEAVEDQRQKREAERARVEQTRVKLASELSSVRSLIAERRFFEAETTVKQAISLSAWTPEEVAALELLTFRTVRNVPASETDVNEVGYRLLSLLAPDNETYQESYQRYKARRDKEAEAQRRRLAEQAAEARREADARRLREGKERFDWIASRLNSQNSEAQRQFAFEQVEGKLVVGSGRVESVERAGLLTPPTVTLGAGYGGLTVFCRLPSATSNASLARISKGIRFECVGELSSYTFLWGSASLSIYASE